MEVQQPLANYTGSPQIEDGHTKIANELLDAIIQTDFTKRQYKILLYIMRKTYGWNKTEDDIARSQIVEATQLKNPHVTTTIQELLEMNVLIVSNGKFAKRYKINKLYDTWRVTKTVTITKSVNVTETVTITETVTDCYQNGNFSLPKQYPQKTTPKDNTKDNIYKAQKYEPPISKELLKEWMQHRKRKPVTERVINKIKKEADKLNWSLEQAIIYCCENSWQGFEAQWVLNKNQTNSIKNDRAGAVQAIFGKNFGQQEIIEKDITDDAITF